MKKALKNKSKHEPSKIRLPFCDKKSEINESTLNAAD